MEAACIALGSNLDDRMAHLRAGLAGAERTPGLEVRAVSGVYETAPVGGPAQGAYLNAAALLEVELEPAALLARLLEIEGERGRERSGVADEPRVLDLDLLLYGERRLSAPGLAVPHPRMATRAFVLTPLAEVAGEWIHPALGKSIAELARRVADPVGVQPWPEKLR